jgi:predicted PurR-regulated permease PerM
LLNLIPYVGILIAGVLGIIATLTTSTDFSSIIDVIVVNTIVQLIDNNIIVPLVVSSKVRINAIVSVIGIVIGGSLAGVAGMFLAIPVIAILKVIFDRIESLEPWGFLLGDNLPKTFEFASIKFPSLDAGNTEEHEKNQENTYDKL